MPEKVLVDTSALIEALRTTGVQEVRDEVQRTFDEGSLVTCELILLELWNGARGDREVAFLRDLERDIESLPITSEVWERAKRLARHCRQNGLTIPATDLLIASCAVHHGAALLHHDRHFDLIQNITT